MSPEIARKVVTLFQKTAPPDRMDESLTPHEVRLLRLLSEGHSYQTPRPLQSRSRKQGAQKENHFLGALGQNLPFLQHDSATALQTNI
jgi:hypothetical protein